MEPLVKYVLLSALLLSGSSAVTRASATEPSGFNVVPEELIVEVNGYPVPTRDAFRRWLLINGATGRVLRIHRYFLAAGIRGDLPLYLVLLQGSDWQPNGNALFSLPGRQHWDNMVRTLRLIETEVIPVVGNLIPVSGGRSAAYNATAGGAPGSKHLIFCALDLVPIRPIVREDLHHKLQRLHRRLGREHSMGLGLYAGLRFHIDTCGYRHW